MILICAVICWQDLKQRAVHWILFPSLFVAAVFIGYKNGNLLDSGWNLSLLIVLLGSLTLYLSFKHGRLINIANGFFSWGDILFLIAIIPAFHFQLYLMLFTAGTIITLVTHLLVRSLLKGEDTIPYAGYMAVCTATVSVFYSPIQTAMSWN